MPPQTVDYARQIAQDVQDWLDRATVDDLIKHGVIASVTPVEYPLPEGRRPYEFWLSLGCIQQLPALVHLQSACQRCPIIHEKKALAWIMQKTGGRHDPNRVVRVLRIVRQVLQEEDAKGLAAQQAATLKAQMEAAHAEAVKNSRKPDAGPGAPQG